MQLAGGNPLAVALASNLAIKARQRTRPGCSIHLGHGTAGRRETPRHSPNKRGEKMRRLLCLAVIVLFAVVPAASHAQQPAPPPSSGGLTGGQIVALAIVTAAVAAVAWYAVA